MITKAQNYTVKIRFYEQWNLYYQSINKKLNNIIYFQILYTEIRSTIL
jgi:hypothetical protein